MTKLTQFLSDDKKTIHPHGGAGVRFDDTLKHERQEL